MKLKTIKTEAEVRRACSMYADDRRPMVEITSVNGSIRAVRIGSLHIAASYGLEVSREVPHEEETRYKLVASAKGLPTMTQYFDDYGKMLDAKREFGDGVEVETFDNVKVLVDGNGTVVGEVETAQPVPQHDELTF
jgi:hypothetical protein